MAFHSPGFLLGFLPLALIAYSVAKRLHASAALMVIIVASLVFYALVDASALPILFTSLLWNYGCGLFLVATSTADHQAQKKFLLILGITGNILLLAFYKYAPSLPSLLPGDILPASLKTWMLPLGISFFTFSQISYLIELAQGRIAQPNILSYCASVLFFPKLVAGPITRPGEILPQLSAEHLGIRNVNGFLRGLSFLAIGLFKKVVIADQLARIASPVFTSAMHTSPTFYRAWFGATTYGLQLYFDFSGYTDMAIGIAFFFGIALPLNFESPYTAVSISEFWRKWHISLASFFRDYVYIPLGGNRHGFLRKMLNLMIVMVIVGIWHGSGFLFAIWGALHGLCLIIHNIWMILRQKLGWTETTGGFASRLSGRALTFLTVTALWVFFRAENLTTALSMLRPMFALPERLPNSFELLVAAVTLLPPLAIVWFLPTTQRWLQYRGFLPPALVAETTPVHIPDATPIDAPAPLPEWRPTFLRGLIVGCIAVVAVAFLSRGIAFIYGNF